MPKLPRDVSHDRLIRFLQRHGWQAVEGTRHTLMVKGTEALTVPRHALLRTGTVRAILREAALERESWADL